MRARIEPEGRTLRSASVSMVCAIKPYSVNGSSRERAIKVSKTLVFNPCAVDPAFRLNGLRLSKVPRNPIGQTAAFQRSGIGIGQMIEGAV